MSLYNEFMEAFKSANPDRSKEKRLFDGRKLWLELKADEKVVKAKIQELKDLAAIRKHKNSLHFFLTPKPSSSNAAADNTVGSHAVPSEAEQEDVVVVEDASSDHDVGLSPAGGVKRKVPAYKQDKLRDELSMLDKEIGLLITKQSKGFLDSDGGEQLRQKIKEKAAKEKELDKTERNAQRQLKHRRTQASLIASSEAAPSQGPTLGRPRLETIYPELLEGIMDIVDGQSGVDSRRRSETLNAVTTLGQLHTKLKGRGFEISQSALYLRLLPTRSNTTEGKNHKVTVPVKLIKPSNDEHKHHDDSRFCFQTIENIKRVASILGPKQVLITSVDDKAKVPLGVTAAKLQTPMVMSMKYKVRLPDHDFVVASKHKLVPSVTALLSITPDKFTADAVKYSGKKC